MRFVTTTSQTPGAVIGATVGHFLTCGETHIVLNLVSRLALYRVEAGGAEGDDCVAPPTLVSEFPLFATIKYIEAVPVVDPVTRVLLRHVLFLLSVKQEISVVALVQNKDSSLGVVEQQPRFITLYHASVDAYLYQYYPDEVNLVCSSPRVRTQVNQDGSRIVELCGSSALTTELPAATLPLVVFGICRGELLLLDVLGACAQYSEGAQGKRRRRPCTSRDGVSVDSSLSLCRTDIFPEHIWQLAKERAKADCLSRCALHSSEYDVRDIAFLPRTPSLPASAREAELAVLYADIHGRAHVSLYALSCEAAAPAPPSKASPVASSPFQYLESVLEGYDRRFSRKGVLVANCDPTACSIIPTGDVTLLVGSLLVTAVPHAGAWLSGAATVSGPMTKELPHGLELACTCVSTSGDELAALALFKDGSLASIPLDGPSSFAVRRPSHKLSCIPVCAVDVARNCLLVTSRFDNSVLVNLASHEETVLVDNAGPVLDLAVIRDETTCPTVVAATGVGKNGGVSFVRAAVTVREHYCTSLWPLQATRVLQAGRVVALTSEYGSRYLILNEGDEFTGTAETASVALRSVAFDTILSDMAVVALQFRAGDGCYLLLDRTGSLHCAGLVKHALESGGFDAWSLVRDEAQSCSIGMNVLFAEAAGAGGPSPLIVISDGFNALGYSNLAQTAAGHPALCCFKSDVAISCLTVVSRETVLIGDWSATLSVLDARQGTVRSRVQLSAVPTSVALVCVNGSAAAGPPHLLPRALQSEAGDGGNFATTGLHVFAGLINGCYQEVSFASLRGTGAHATATDAVSDEVFLMNRPVEFVTLPGRSAILCKGDTPLLLLVTASRQSVSVDDTSAGDVVNWATVDLTGFSVTALVDCCHCTDCEWAFTASTPSPTMPHSSACAGGLFVFLTTYNGCHSVVLGTLPDTTQRTSRTFVRMGCTVTHVRYIEAWERFALSLRQPDMDAVVFLPASLSGTLWNAPTTSSPTVTLLANERCVFIEPVPLDKHSVSHSGRSVAGSPYAAGSAAASDSLVVVGSTFTFPDEQSPRSSRITWYQRPTDARVTEKNSKDVGGQLQCCCSLALHPGRIALGVNGCVQLFSWNAQEATFVAEECLRIGMMVTKLIPLRAADVQPPISHSKDVAASSSATSAPEALSGRGGNEPTKADGERDESVSFIAALDARYSATFLTCDPLRGGLAICGRDKSLRGVMDGEVILDAGTGRRNVCITDDNMNFICLTTPPVIDGLDDANEGHGDPTHTGTRPVPVGTTAAASPTSNNTETRAGARVTSRMPDDAASDLDQPGDGGERAAGQLPRTAAAGGEAVSNDAAARAPFASAPSPVPARGVHRLEVQAQTHLGDLVTAMHQGSFSFATIEGGNVNTRKSSLPGIFPDQLVYGTTHGGFGVVSPVTEMTFVFLKALELAVSCTGESCLGGFTHKAFRELISVGQERVVNLRASMRFAAMGDNKGIADSASSRHRQSNVCDGDVAERYLTLPSGHVRAQVLQHAERITLSALSSPDPTASLNDVEDAFFARELSTLRGDVDLLERCNTLLDSEELPQLPYTDSQVVAVLLKLSRAH